MGACLPDGKTACWLCHSAAGSIVQNFLNTMLRPHAICRNGMVTVGGRIYLRRERESSYFCGIVVKSNPSQCLILLPSNFCMAALMPKGAFIMLINLHFHYPIPSRRTKF